ncbi:hypothetical protein KSU1_D0344 [Candidatus Jettenia caeni]|uniref:Uncharacterized protein n=1 Tax=Candidatus Jettenia caeni TaxID=247490 RepID=I3IPK8_9BACT|nr:hypothetical protein KSU1_D0344 [Candidatus Jettenia caeni]
MIKSIQFLIRTEILHPETPVLRYIFPVLPTFAYFSSFPYLPVRIPGLRLFENYPTDSPHGSFSAPLARHSNNHPFLPFLNLYFFPPFFKGGLGGIRGEYWTHIALSPGG